jgi:hypothetical protein
MVQAVQYRIADFVRHDGGNGSGGLVGCALGRLVAEKRKRRCRFARLSLNAHWKASRREQRVDQRVTSAGRQEHQPEK